MPDLLIPLLRNTSLLAGVALAFGLAMSHLPRAAGPVVLAVLCALAGVISMLDPIEFRPGVFVDSRTTMVMLSSFFAGPVGALITGGILAAYRIWLGGAGLYAGLVGLVIGAGVGVVGHQLCVRGHKKVRSVHVVILALLSPLPSFGVLLLQSRLAVEIPYSTVLPISLSRMSGVLLLGLMILHEEWRIDAETEVRRLAYVDELSGLANRRAFYAALEGAWQRWLRYASPFTVVMIDIDRFKRINDTHGHPVGDEVIRSLADVLKKECRATDTAARIGGEEFVILLAHTESTDAVRFAERIRSRVAEAAIPTEGQPLRFSISLGVSHDEARDGSRQDVLSSADQALYDAKRSGRDRVMLAPRTPTVERPAVPLERSVGHG